jgi:hypothetical protein
MKCNTKLPAKGSEQEDDMAVDVALWFLVAGCLAFVSCGCILTAGNNRSREERLR